jgi:AcrR family transcriptional regulator
VVDAVRPKRKYDSRRRQAQAAGTRRAILQAAQTLFERDGYVPTTMEDIAAEAGVALKTVYSAFTTKSGLLRALWDFLLKGDAGDAPVAERTWYRAMLDEPDPVRQVHLVARNSRVVKERIGRLLGVIRDAATVDPDGAALWQLIQSDFYDNQRAVVEAIARHGGLRPGLDAAVAADVLWTLNHPDVWLLLVGQRHWTADQFESWFGAAVSEQLLGVRPA